MCGKLFNPDDVWYNQLHEDEDLAVRLYGLCDECSLQSEEVGG